MMVSLLYIAFISTLILMLAKLFKRGIDKLKAINDQGGYYDNDIPINLIFSD